MIKFLVDADLPLSLLENLKALGYSGNDVRLIGLRSASDDKIFTYAVENGYILLSGDKGFANILRFPLGTHNGLVVARFLEGTPRNTKFKSLRGGSPHYKRMTSGEI